MYVADVISMKRCYEMNDNLMKNKLMPFVIRLKKAPRCLGVNLQGTMTNEPNDGIIIPLRKFQPPCKLTVNHVL